MSKKAKRERRINGKKGKREKGVRKVREEEAEREK